VIVIVSLNATIKNQELTALAYYTAIAANTQHNMKIWPMA